MIQRLRICVQALTPSPAHSVPPTPASVYYHGCLLNSASCQDHLGRGWHLPTLVVTSATARGIDVIVTDHHEAGPELPQALAVINAKVYPELKDLELLSGAGAP